MTSRLDRALQRATPHGFAAAGVLLILPTAPVLWLADPLPAVIALFGVMLLGAGYLMRSGSVWRIELERDDAEHRIAEDRLYRELATGELPFIGDEPRGKHAS